MKLKEIKEKIQENGALERRLTFLAQNYLNQNYNINARMFGFKPLKVNGKEELMGRMKEIADILEIDFIELKNQKTNEIRRIELR